MLYYSFVKYFNSDKQECSNMSKAEMPKAYEPAEVEAKWYPEWENRGLFHIRIFYIYCNDRRHIWIIIGKLNICRFND